jgi:hypothetical protein
MRAFQLSKFWGIHQRCAGSVSLFAAVDLGVKSYFSKSAKLEQLF